MRPCTPSACSRWRTKCGLAGAQRAMQRDEAIAQCRACSPARGKGPRRGFVGQHHAFYNRRYMHSRSLLDGSQWVSRIQAWGQELGFSQIGVAGIDLSACRTRIAGVAVRPDSTARWTTWPAMASNAPGRPNWCLAVSVVTARMDYLPAAPPTAGNRSSGIVCSTPTKASCRCMRAGRDYHKVMRQRLQTTGRAVQAGLGPLGFRAFTDSAPVLEAELAVRSGQGWRGKHTLVLDRNGGSMFFLGELFLDMALPPTASRSMRIAAAAAPASPAARRRRSWRPTGWMHDAASPT
jgi:hypothetical protein